MSQPLVLTLRLDAASEKLLTTLRTRYFPQGRNHLKAHVTLFHAIPSSAQTSTSNLLSRISSRVPGFTVGVKDPFLLGINIASFKLRKLHDELLDALRSEGVALTEQDERKLRPHVTVQNKVGEQEAARTLKQLRGSWEDTAGKAVGLVMWRYEQGGSWTHLRDFPFSTPN